MKRRGEILERTFAHTLESGAMRRAFLRLRDNVVKRDLVHVAGFNLSLVMRPIFGVGTPRGLRGRLQLALEAPASALGRLIDDTYRRLAGLSRLIALIVQPIPAGPDRAFSTGG